jgi:hypothetical protein
MLQDDHESPKLLLHTNLEIPIPVWHLSIAYKVVMPSLVEILSYVANIPELFPNFQVGKSIDIIRRG